MKHTASQLQLHQSSQPMTISNDAIYITGVSFQALTTTWMNSWSIYLILKMPSVTLWFVVLAGDFNSYLATRIILLTQTIVVTLVCMNSSIYTTCFLFPSAAQCLVHSDHLLVSESLELNSMA